MLGLGRDLVMPHLLKRADNPAGLNRDVTTALACAMGQRVVLGAARSVSSRVQCQRTVHGVPRRDKGQRRLESTEEQDAEEHGV